MQHPSITSEDLKSYSVCVSLWSKFYGELDHFIGEVKVPASSPMDRIWKNLQTKGMYGNIIIYRCNVLLVKNEKGAFFKRKLL